MKEVKENKSRRDFLKRSGYMLGISVAASSLPLFVMSCEKDESPIPPPPVSTVDIEINKYTDLASVGGAIKLLVKGKNANNPIIIFRKDADNFSIYDSYCTHGGGATIPLPDSGKTDMKCPLHGATFSIQDGSLVNNPVGGWSGIPLKTYPSTFDKAKNILKVEL
jgi:nitrite reductase/ring-hydroxylating ferredoxin subunit